MKSLVLGCITAFLLFSSVVVGWGQSKAPSDTLTYGLRPYPNNNVYLYELKTYHMDSVSITPISKEDLKFPASENKIAKLDATANKVILTKPVMVSKLVLSSSIFITQTHNSLIKARYMTVKQVGKKIKEFPEDLFIQVTIPGQAPPPPSVEPTNQQSEKKMFDTETKFSDDEVVPYQPETLANKNMFTQSFFIRKSDYESMRPVYSINRFGISVLVLPFKYRFGTKNNKAFFTGESTISGAVSVRLTPSNSSFDNHLYAVIGAGVSILNSSGKDSTSGKYSQLATSSSAALTIRSSIENS